MKTRQITNIVALVAVLVVNWLATSLPINGVTPGEISDSVPSLFTPAGYVFSIWGLIYMWLLAYVAYQALPGQCLIRNIRQEPHIDQAPDRKDIACGCKQARHAIRYLAGGHPVDRKAGG